jgi:biotin synthase-like enzyme
MLEEIAREIGEAAADRRKTTMIHFQVLKNAKSLRDVDAAEFCRVLGLEESWKAEFRKMIRLAEMISDQGLELAPVRG